MEQRLQELKEKITSFVNDYKIEKFHVWIDEGNSRLFEDNKEVNLEIRM